MGYFIPATYEPCTTNSQTKHVLRAAVASTKFHSSPLSPSLLVSLPSHHLSHQAAVNAASTGCPLHNCCMQGGQTSLGDKHRWAVHNCLPTEKDVNILMLSGQLSHLLFFQLQPEIAIDTFSRTKLNFGRGQNEAVCFDFLSAHLTAPA